MKQGILILKPDFFDTIENYDTLSMLITKQELKISASYKINNFGSFCETYRSHDIQKTYAKSSSEYFDELRKTSYATTAYQLKYTDDNNFGVALFFETSNSQNTELYEKLLNIKNEFREIQNNQNPLKSYLVINKEPKYIINCKPEEIENIELAQNIDTRLIYFNRIHLEEKFLYENNICQNFLEQSNICKPENNININDETIYRTQENML